MRVSFSEDNKGTEQTNSLFFHVSTPLLEGPSEADYGGLSISSATGSTGSGFERVIANNDETVYHRYRNATLQAMDDEIGDDKDNVPWLLDTVDSASDCSRNNWEQKLLLINCNTFHEHTLDRPEDDLLQSVTARYVGHGSYRDTWIMMDQLRHLNSPTHPEIPDGFVLKCMILDDPDLKFDHKRYGQTQVDAIVMERLTASPRIADIYGHCGTSVAIERLVPTLKDHMCGSWRCKVRDQEVFDQLQKDVVHPMNNLTNAQKLDMAIDFAESMADVHGFDGGVMFHGDFHSAQWLHSVDGRIKFNDFNKAVIMKFNRTAGEYCPTRRCYKNTFRAPEDTRCKYEGTEASDVYSLANTFYMLLTGLLPFYEYTGTKKRLVKKIRNEGRRPFVDPRYYNRSAVETGLLRIMEQCWEFDIKKRISVFEVLRQLYELRSTTTVDAVPAI